MKTKPSRYCAKCGEFCPAGTLDDGLCLECECARHVCTRCRTFNIDEEPRDGTLVTGRIYSFARARFVVFRGYLCERHIAELMAPGWRRIEP